MASAQKTNRTNIDHSDAYAQDSLKRYLADIRTYPVLTREEESHFALAALDGQSKAADHLVNCNLRLVVKIALEYQSSRINLLDLIQEGNLGLIQAVRKFDIHRNIRLSTYAQFWIRAFILKYLMDNYKLVKVGTTQAQRKLFYNLKREKERLIQQGIQPTAEALARHLDVREKDIVEMETRLTGREVSLDAPINDESNSLIDIIPSAAIQADDAFEQKHVSKHISARMRRFRTQLKGRDCEIWDRRLVSDQPLTLQELGDLFGVSRERARQLEARVLRSLSRYLSEDKDFVDAIELGMPSLLN